MHGIRNGILIIQIASIILFSTPHSFVYGLYLWNYDYVVKELCVNRFDPKSECNGSCHLMKNMSASSHHVMDGHDHNDLDFPPLQNHIKELLRLPILFSDQQLRFENQSGGKKTNYFVVSLNLYLPPFIEKAAPPPRFI